MSAMLAVVAVCAYMVEYPFVRESYIPLLLLTLMCYPQSKCDWGVYHSGYSKSGLFID